MASTEQQYNSVSQSLAQTVSTANDDLTELTSQLKSIQANPTQPDAKAQLSLIKERLDIYESANWGNMSKGVSDLTGVYSTLPPAEQQTLAGSFGQSTQSVASFREQVRAANALVASTQTAVDSGIASGGAGAGRSNTENNTVGSDEDAGTLSGSSNTRSEAVGISTRPRKNPLGNFASYTYQLTLYMITPDAYDAFVLSGRKNINALREGTGGNNGQDQKIEGGAFIIAQSGGVNSQYRLEPNFHLDYYIDNLTITTHTTGGGEINSTNIKFDIIEPYGFSFLSNLRRAHEQLLGYSAGLSTKLSQPINQFYILGIRFYGYDANGNIVSGKDELTFQEADPTISSNGIYEKFYDILIKDLKFKIDGKATVYNIEGVQAPVYAGLGLKRGTIKQGLQIEASTIEEAFNQLVEKMNYTENTSNTEPRNHYSVKFIGNEDEVALLKNAKIFGPNDPLKGAWATSGAKNTLEVNDALSVITTPNPLKKIITSRNETTVVTAMNMIVKQSEYMLKALDVVYSTQQKGANGQPIEKNQNRNYISWFNLSCEVKNAKWNPDISDWVYDITYVVQPYSTPAVYSPFISNTLKYYGPHKRYEYYFTGKNSEVISYEQNFNVGYFTVAINQQGLNPDPNAGSSALVPPVTPGKRTDQPRMGLPNQGLEAQNQVLTSLFEPGAQAASKLTILGDPDFLVSANPSSLSQVYDKFYGSDGYTINPNGGQIFVEVDFKEAVDYNINSGTLDINESILFFKNPKEIAKSIKGCSFLVQDAISKFENGKFIQTLILCIKTFSDYQIAQSTASVSGISESQQRSDTLKAAEQATAGRKDSRQLMEEINSARAATEGSVRGEATLAKEASGLKSDEKANLSNIEIPAIDPIKPDRPIFDIGSLELSTGDD